MELLPKKRPGSGQYLAPKGSTSWLLLVGTDAGLNSEPPNLRTWGSASSVQSYMAGAAYNGNLFCTPQRAHEERHHSISPSKSLLGQMVGKLKKILKWDSHDGEVAVLSWLISICQAG